MLNDFFIKIFINYFFLLKYLLFHNLGGLGMINDL